MRQLSRLAWGILLAFAGATLLNAQQFDWVKTMSGSGSGIPMDMALDDQGFIYCTGNFFDTVDFDPGPGTTILVAKGQADMFVCKVSPQGDLVWVRQLEGRGNAVSLSRGVDVDAEGNVYFAGGFTDTVDFDPGPGTLLYSTPMQNQNQLFVSKLDSSGNLVWANQFKGGSGSWAYDLKLHPGGGLLVVGSFSGNVDFDPGPNAAFMNSTASSTGFVMRLDSSGNLVWAKQPGGPGAAIYGSVSLDSAGNIFLPGTVKQQCDMDPGPGIYNLTGLGFRNGCVTKFDKNGDFKWAVLFEDTVLCGAGSVVIDAGGNVYVSGSFQDVCDFDPGPGVYPLTSAGTNDGFFCKLDSLGNLIWAIGTGGTGEDTGRKLNLDDVGNLYAVGHFSDTVDFDPGPGTTTLISQGGLDAYVRKLDPQGNLIWVYQLAGPADMTGNLLELDENLNLFAVGHFTDSVDFDPGPGNYSVYGQPPFDMYVHKMTEGVVGLDASFSREIRLYPNPTNDLVGIKVGKMDGVMGYEVLNGMGQLVLEGECSREPCGFSMPGPSGMYFVRIRMGDLVWVRQLVKL